MTPRTTAVAATALALLASIASAEDYKLGHQFAPDSLPGLSAVKFAELVEEKTGGETTITVLPGGALGDERANLEQLSNGSLDLALTGTLVVDFMAQPYSLVSMPFLYDDEQHAQAVFNGEIGAEIGDYLRENHDIQPLGWQFVGNRQMTADEPITNAEELQGLSLRLPSGEISIATWSKTGVQVTSVAFTELYLALQTGTVAAQENPPNFIRAQKFYEVQDYVIMTNHRPQMQAFLVNGTLLDGMDEATRTAIVEAGAEAAAWASAEATAQGEADLEWLTTEGGMEKLDFDVDSIRGLIKDVPAEFEKLGGTALYDRIRAAAS